MLELLSLIPTLLKGIPLIAAGILYLLYKRAVKQRQEAEVERDGLKASYEVAEEVREIREEEREVEENMDQMDPDELAATYRSGVCKPRPDKG